MPGFVGFNAGYFGDCNTWASCNTTAAAGCVVFCPQL